MTWLRRDLPFLTVTSWAPQMRLDEKEAMERRATTSESEAAELSKRLVELKMGEIERMNEASSAPSSAKLAWWAGSDRQQQATAIKHCLCHWQQPRPLSEKPHEAKSCQSFQDLACILWRVEEVRSVG